MLEARNRGRERAERDAGYMLLILFLSIPALCAIGVLLGW